MPLMQRLSGTLATAPYIVLDDDTEAGIEKLSLDAFFIIGAPAKMIFRCVPPHPVC
ncbi:hypothetical protein [Serratia ureilytica]|nr:hypothetical protein [Serratia ureilytica]